MSWRRRSVWIAAGAAALLVLGTLGYVASGSSAIESWVGSQLLQIGATYLEPQLHFERLTYVRPRTIVLDNLTLSSPDPANPGHSVVILAVKRARLELTEIPRRGEPVTFSEVTLESPQIHAIAARPGGARLLGFANLVKGASAAPVSSLPAPPPPMKLSDFLLIRHITIVDGTISYNPRTADMPPIWLDGIQARLDFSPVGTSANGGLYAIATTITRKPALTLNLQGQVNIDTLTLELAKLELDLDLQPKNAHFLPSELQKLLQSCEVTGQLHVTAAGTLPLTDYRQSTLQSVGQLTGAQVATGPNRFAIGSLDWEVGVANGMAKIRKVDAKLLGGDLHISGMIPLGGAEPMRLELIANDLQIRQMLRSTDPDEIPLYAGLVAANITFSAPLAAWNRQSSGGGQCSIRQGRIDNIPLVGRIVTSLNNSLGKALSGNPHALTDSADASFSFAGDSVQLDHLEGTSGAMAFRATGTIGFDRHLALRINAGPMERLQNTLGGVGKLWASVSDALAGYRVGGTVEDPQVSVEIGGAP